MSHYFINDQNLKNERKIIKTNVLNRDFSFYTDSGVFSKDHFDFGSKLLIENYQPSKVDGKVLDLGCGYGPIGIIVKSRYPKVTLVLSDINQKALSLTDENLKLNQVDGLVIESSSFDNLKGHSFDDILLNPPIHAGKKIIQQMYQESFNHLVEQGSLWLVIHKNHGALSTIDYLSGIFAVVKRINKSKGFFVIHCMK